mmetsp:Transcript_16119/g.31538  ORF Transcript_16119/g.31538 Transcript_16119/m.31538 type:complete len:124 (-) Transcript_16119:1786-2157(-)
MPRPQQRLLDSRPMALTDMMVSLWKDDVGIRPEERPLLVSIVAPGQLYSTLGVYLAPKAQGAFLQPRQLYRLLASLLDGTCHQRPAAASPSWHGKAPAAPRRSECHGNNPPLLRSIPQHLAWQ